MASRPAKSQVSIIAPGSEKKRTAPQMTPFNSVSSTALWTLLTTFAIICLVVLTVVSYLYVTLVNQPPHPLEESMKKLRTTMAVGLRHPKLSDGNALKVAEEAVKLPDHIKDAGKTFKNQKIKYQSWSSAKQPVQLLNFRLTRWKTGGLLRGTCYVVGMHTLFH
ncbi:uncharacterized protein PHA67_023120 isoform 1-T2 [Liasis olivaceus]